MTADPARDEGTGRTPAIPGQAPDASGAADRDGKVVGEAEASAGVALVLREAQATERVLVEEERARPGRARRSPATGRPPCGPRPGGPRCSTASGVRAARRSRGRRTGGPGHRRASRCRSRPRTRRPTRARLRRTTGVGIRESDEVRRRRDRGSEPRRAGRRRRRGRRPARRCRGRGSSSVTAGRWYAGSVRARARWRRRAGPPRAGGGRCPGRRARRRGAVRTATGSRSVPTPGSTTATCTPMGRYGTAAASETAPSRMANGRIVRVSSRTCASGQIERTTPAQIAAEGSRSPKSVRKETNGRSMRRMVCARTLRRRDGLPRDGPGEAGPSRRASAHGPGRRSDARRSTGAASAVDCGDGEEEDPDPRPWDMRDGRRLPPAHMKTSVGRGV